MPNLKIVVFGITPPAFSSFSSDRLRWEYFRDFMSWSDVFELAKFKGLGVIALKICSSFTAFDKRHRRMFFSNLAKRLKGESIRRTLIKDGWSREPGSDADDMRLARLRVRHHFRNADTFDESFVLYYGKILQLCHERGVSVVTLTCPVTSHYARYARNYVTGREFKEKIILNPFFRPYVTAHLDYWGIYANNTRLFASADHLSARGAEQFSRRVARDLEKFLEAPENTLKEPEEQNASALARRKRRR